MKIEGIVITDVWMFSKRVRKIDYSKQILFFILDKISFVFQNGGIEYCCILITMNSKSSKKYNIRELTFSSDINTICICSLKGNTIRYIS